MSKTMKTRRGKVAAPEAPAATADAVKRAPSGAELGRTHRQQVPRSSHADWHPPIDRRDPIEILIQSSVGRVPHLVPLRYGRMLISPFAFYRGRGGDYGRGSGRHTDDRLASAGLR